MTYTRVELNNPVAAPAQPPRIILGQVLTYYGDTPRLDAEIVEAWRRTGLFSAVTVTSSSTPPTQGTYIRTPCQEVRVDQIKGVDALIMGGAWALSAGASPSGGGYDQYQCHTEVYQNGSRLASSHSTWDFIWLRSSWAAEIAYPQTKTLADGFRNAAQHIVNRDLVALKKAFP